MKLRETLVTRYNLPNQKPQTNSKVITVFEYILHYGPVVLLLCMTTSKTGLYSLQGSKRQVDYSVHIQ